MITYDRLWETMKQKGMSEYKLISERRVGAGQIQRMRRNMYVTLHTIETLCKALNCTIGDIVEYVPDRE